MSTFGHRRFKSRLDAYVDGELPMAHIAGVEAHLHDCPDCAGHVRLLLAMRRSLARMGHPHATH